MLPALLHLALAFGVLAQGSRSTEPCGDAVCEAQQDKDMMLLQVSVGRQNPIHEAVDAAVGGINEAIERTADGIKAGATQVLQRNTDAAAAAIRNLSAQIGVVTSTAKQRTQQISNAFGTAVTNTSKKRAEAFVAAADSALSSVSEEWDKLHGHIVSAGDAVSTAITGLDDQVGQTVAQLQKGILNASATAATAAQQATESLRTATDHVVELGNHAQGLAIARIVAVSNALDAALSHADHAMGQLQGFVDATAGSIMQAVQSVLPEAGAGSLVADVRVHGSAQELSLLLDKLAASSRGMLKSMRALFMAINEGAKALA